MALTVRDLMAWMEEIAPSRLAESWDRLGLQVGSRDWPAQRVRVALDALPEVVDEACRQGVHCLITHHPLLFSPPSSLDCDTPLGRIIEQALAHRLAIFAAHTNLDAVSGGINDLLARRIGLESIVPLVSAAAEERCKLVCFVPRTHETRFLDALFESPAGRIGPYDRCTFRVDGTGTYRPAPEAHAFAGAAGEVSHAEEVRIEVLVLQRDLNAVLAHVRSHHPYETMAYDVYPLTRTETGTPGQGIGRVGRLSAPESLESLATRLKADLGISHVRMVGAPDRQVMSVALCSGGGGSLLKNFLASGADVYITGDIKYHEALTIRAEGRAVIDVGHFASERIVVPVLAERLADMARDRGVEMTLDVCPLERDPFLTL